MVYETGTGLKEHYKIFNRIKKEILKSKFSEDKTLFNNSIK